MTEIVDPIPAFDTTGLTKKQIKDRRYYYRNREKNRGKDSARFNLWYIKNRERLLEYKKRYSASRRDKMKSHVRLWYRELKQRDRIQNKEKIKAKKRDYSRSYYQNHKAEKNIKSRINSKKRYAANREKFLAKRIRDYYSQKKTANLFQMLAVTSTITNTNQ